MGKLLAIVLVIIAVASAYPIVTHMCDAAAGYLDARPRDRRAVK